MFGLFNNQEQEASKRAKRLEASAESNRIKAKANGSDTRKAVQAKLDAATDAATRRAETLSAEERKIIAQDEQQRFVRLRESAEAAGFNPLTLLDRGFFGSSLPTGILSPQAPAANQREANVLSAYQQGDFAYQTEIGARSMIVNAEATGDQMVMQGMQADKAFLTDVAQLAINAATGFGQYKQGQKALALDAERLQLDREIAYMPRPSYGGSRRTTVGGGTLSRTPADLGVAPNAIPLNDDGTPKDRDLRSRDGTLFKVDERESPASYFEDEYGEAAGFFEGTSRYIEDKWNQNVAPKLGLGSDGLSGAARRLWADVPNIHMEMQNRINAARGNTAFKVEVK